MEVENLKEIFDQFQHLNVYESYKELSSGHINDTYLIITKTRPYFVLQRINHSVFKDVAGLINNKVAISQHIKSKLKESKKQVLDFVKSNDDNSYYKDIKGNYWSLMYYIDNSVTYETVNDIEIAYEGGKLFGEFLNLTSDFDTSQLTEVIPKFHNMSFRYSQFQSALQSAAKERLFKATETINMVTELKEEMHILQNLKESGDIKLRVTHNDTKISNALFTKDNKGLCVIDTDTVMPGIVHYDFGDAIRTICNSAAEDEANLDLVNFNFDFYKAYTRGFLEEIQSSLTDLEIKYLPLGAKTMTYIMALRFLTDYLNNDIYYKIKYEDHNLVRAKNQLKLIESFSEKIKEIQQEII
ncbi:MAG: aminoglycoside phosphotransferase family protein [Algibacter sp.]|uniref:phosphotransferase enzyme family protein n=1 Tax=Algibacter sp. TaxID=1872428 RepID=UPI0032991174